jgi:hypothetical protein
MSLINDALKKAQKQRTGETPTLSSMPSVGGESPQRIARRAKPAGFDTLMVRAGIGAGVLLVVVVGSYFAFRSDSDDRRQTADVNPVAGVADPGPPSPTPATPPATSAPQPAAPAPAFTLPVAPVQKSEIGGQRTAQASEPPVVRPPSSNAGPAVAAAPTPTGSDPRVSPFSAPPKTATQQPTTNNQPPVQIPAAERPKLEPRAIQFIENIKVAGIRASATDAKVLMNDRVYRIGSIVEAELGLKLVEINTNSLTFEDDRGGRYTRTF